MFRIFSRIGIGSGCTSNWQLDGYELQINGKLLCANNAIGARAADTLAEIEQQWATSRAELGPLLQQMQELKSLVDAGLASEEEQQQLAELDQQIDPLQASLSEFESVLTGASPWYVDGDAELPGQGDSTPVSEAKVTLITAAHTNSQTYNHIYVRLGGRKYFLYPRQNLFSSDASPQQFKLDLAQGPLSAGDLRSVGLGMVAHSLPYAEAPDRWHPQRLIVEIDGKTTYDSDDEPVDRMSLAAIRLIPPVHVDDASALRENVLTNDETYVWLSGQAQGIDLLGGGGGSDSTDDVVPLPEPGPDDGGLGPVAAQGGEAAGDGSDAGYFPGEQPLAAEPPPGYDPNDPTGLGGTWGDATGQPFEPGDDGSLGDGWGDPGDGWGEPGSGWGEPGYDDLSGSDWNDPFGAADDSGFFDVPGSDGDPLSTFDWQAVLDWVSQLMDVLAVAENPARIGEAPQVENVRVVRDDIQHYRVAWELSETGDRSLVTSFNVQLIQFDPSTGGYGELLHVEPDVPPEVRTVSLDLSHVDDSLDKTFWVLPFVSATMDESDRSPVTGQAGPAIPWLSAMATKQNQPKLFRRFHGRPIFDPPPESLVGSSVNEPETLFGSVREQMIVPVGDFHLATADYTSNAVIARSALEPFEVGLRYLIRDCNELAPDQTYQVIGHIGRSSLTTGHRFRSTSVTTPFPCFGSRSVRSVTRSSLRPRHLPVRNSRIRWPVARYRRSQSPFPAMVVEHLKARSASSD